MYGLDSYCLLSDSPLSLTSTDQHLFYQSKEEWEDSHIVATVSDTVDCWILTFFSTFSPSHNDVATYRCQPEQGLLGKRFGLPN